MEIESYIVAWLKHIKKCQITLTNWRGEITSWELQSEDTIRGLMEITDKFFSKNYGFNLYENWNIPLPVLQEGIIDFLGLKIHSGIFNIYGVITVLDENCSDYNGDLDQLEQIIKKITSTALLPIGYLNTTNANIIFVATKMNERLYEVLVNVIKGLNNIFESMGYDFTFDVITNNKFKEIISEPVNELIKAPAKKEPSLKNNQSQQPSLLKEPLYNPGNRIENIGDRATTKIGKFIRFEFKKLIDKELLTDEIVHNLCDSKYCKEILDLRFPMLKKYNDEQPLMEQRLVKGNGRYYSHIYFINGQKYLLTNDWYERNRGKLLQWIDKFHT